MFVITIGSVCLLPALAVLTGISLAEAAPQVSQRTMTFEQRVEYQRKIEEVYWRHRIWPNERSDPKPPLETVMSRERIENKVRNQLRKSDELEDCGQQPISSQQLQAELERMAQHTKDPEMLRELFAALGNDPFIIAECLARPALSDRVASELSETSPNSGSEAIRNEPSWLHSQRMRGASNATAGGAPVFTGYSLPALSDTTSECTDNSWSPLIDLPARRAQHSAVWTGSEMIVWGGFNYDVTIGTGNRYNPATDSWSKVTLTYAPNARCNHTAVWTGTEMIVWGGYRSGDYILNSGGKYNPATDTWTPTSLTNAPAARQFHTAVWTGSAMIVWGGQGATGFPNAGGRYDPETDSWTAMNTTNAPLGRIQHSANWIGTEMLIWGGRAGATGYLNNGAKYNPVSDTWTNTNTANAPAARFGHSAVWTGTEIIIWGGWNGGALNSGARYNPSSNTWTALNATNPPVARYFHSGVWTGNEMIVWGGTVFQNGQETSGSRYNPATDTWSPTSITNAPSPRDTHTTIWTGSEMVVWGGGYGETLNTGGRYDPITNTWTSISTTNVPHGRYEHRAVWTGSEMIVWGGELNTLSATNSGGRYDPALDTWTPTDRGNAPEGREAHTAVWTGTEMIVWGGWFAYGFSGYSIVNTGGRYNPATDHWTATALTNAPDPRRFHSAVWTGNEMIVWGGELGSGGAANTGGRYNPSTNSWIATSMTGAPGPKIYHTAVWTGSEMIIWGGGPYVPTNTGARYNPVNDSWTATSIINTPPRVGHTAVWTGTEMIVWGGYNGSVHINTGARYSPNTDRWTATSVYNAPDARGANAIVWTGDEMIVWGGYSNQLDRFLNTGGRYRPSTDSWTATTSVNVPNKAEYPTAVWTGSRMIVWGGYYVFYDNAGTHSYVLSTGGQYCVGTSSTTGKLANISTRAFVQTGDNAMIGGLIVTGSGPQRVILRAIGPSLSNSGINDALPDPVLELHDSTGALIAFNNNWMDSANSQLIIDSGLAPSHNLESAILTNLNPGAYTALLRGINNGTGTAVVEAYGLDQAASSKLGNISTRAFAETGNKVMIGGLIVNGPGTENVVARALGPSLTQSGIANALADPFLELRDRNGALVTSNDNWMDAPNRQAIIESGLAPSYNLESAILTSLIPGPYTAILRGANNGSGVALVEVFGLN